MNVVCARKLMEKAIEQAKQRWQTRAEIEGAIPKEYADELTEKGYNVLVYLSKNEKERKTIVDFSDNSEGKHVVTDCQGIVTIF